MLCFSARLELRRLFRESPEMTIEHMKTLPQIEAASMWIALLGEKSLRKQVLALAGDPDTVEYISNLFAASEKKRRKVVAQMFSKWYTVSTNFTNITATLNSDWSWQ
jgi:hypothetical protein